MYKTMLLVSLAGLAAATPIPITGGGTFWFDNRSGFATAGWQVSFHGTAGEHSVSLSADCNSPLTWCAVDGTRGPAMIDGMPFYLGSFAFSLGSPGWVQGYGQTGRITEEIDGVLHETGRSCFAVNACQGTFTITPGMVSNPEPGSLWLGIVGLAVTIAGARTHRKAARGTSGPDYTYIESET